MALVCLGFVSISYVVDAIATFPSFRFIPNALEVKLAIASLVTYVLVRKPRSTTPITLQVITEEQSVEP